MSEPTLQMAFKELRENLGDWLGYGRGDEATPPEKAWTNSQAKAVAMFLKEGQADFYFCAHNWSFLRPVVALTLADAANTVQLPDDFGGLEGRIYYSVADGQGWCPIEVGPVGRIYQREAELTTTTGTPQWACIEPLKGTTLTHGSRMQLRLWPTADQDYTLKFQYYVNPDVLSGSHPYAYGGAQHAHTLLQACKAAAERHDGLPPQAGPEQIKFRERLAISIEVDSRQQPQHFGYNADRSDWRDQQWGRSRFGLNAVTFAGVEPD